MAYCMASRLRDAILHAERPTIDEKLLSKVASKRFPHIVSGVDGSQRHHTFPDEDSYSDSEPPFQIDRVILSGSWSEGLFLYTDLVPADLDYMLVLKNISFSEEDQRNGNLLQRNDTPFVYAFITQENSVKMWSEFLVDHLGSSGKRLSSLKLKEKLCENHKKLLVSLEKYGVNDIDDSAAMNIIKINGEVYLPSSLSTSGLAIHANAPGCKRDLVKVFRKLCTFTSWDIVLAISCDGWPFCAKEWITRERLWPPDDIVQKISKAGFHIVPKSSTDGDFRLSFSRAETMLIQNLSDVQYKVLRSFKVVVKYHQHNWSSNIKEIITTYHLKTISFWYFEKVPISCFAKEDVVTHLIALLQQLAESLRRQELSMYFLPKVNLFEHVKNLKTSSKIARKIDLLSEDFSSIFIALDSNNSVASLDWCETTKFLEELDDS